MPQFFLPSGAVENKKFHLVGTEAFHVTRVLRAKIGDVIQLFDGHGGRFEGIIDCIADSGVEGSIVKVLIPAASRSPVRITVYQGLLKSAHWDCALEKGTELGVAAFVPLLTPRTVVILHEAERAHAKRERWNRVVLAAAKQCDRADLPEVREPQEFRDAIKMCGAASLKGKNVTLLAWEGLSGATAADTLRGVLREADHARSGAALEINLFIGPEGGFSDEEVELAKAAGAHIIGLGPRVMRADTAALAAVALIQYELGAL